MREILFRAKEFYDNEWVEGFYVHANKSYSEDIDRHFIIEHGEFFYDNYSAWIVKSETVGQYTGLSDKNGKKIFEGDICRFREWNKGEMCWVGKVYWEHQQFMIAGSPNKECETMFELRMSRFIPEDIEVIGNIHDNPELLEVAK